VAYRADALLEAGAAYRAGAPLAAGAAYRADALLATGAAYRADALLEAGAAFRGRPVKPLQAFARLVDRTNERLGRTIAWLALLIVLLQFVVVVLRYVFGLGSVKMQESIVYMHATLFMVAAGYTLLHNGHVRCDIFYSAASPRTKAIIDLFGVCAFLLPTCALIAWVAWPYVAAAWEVREGSPEGSLGIPGVYLLKSVILVFAGLLVLQGLALAIHSALLLAGIEAERGTADESAEAGV
jgi:TRAP-type mannitol/chloroaromatic compound transport system permease small subunit